MNSKGLVEVKVYYDREDNTLTVLFGDPANDVLAVSQRESVAEEAGEEIVWMEDKDGKVIGFEKLNFTAQTADALKVTFETVTA